MSEEMPTKIGNVQLNPSVDNDLKGCLYRICQKQVMKFRDLDFKDIPKKPGIYLITDLENETAHENAFYVGKSSELRRRIRQHANGSTKNSPTIRYLVSDNIERDIRTRGEAQAFVMERLGVRWIEFDEFNIIDSQGYPEKTIGYVEAYLVARLQPLYGIFNPYRKNLKPK